MMERICVLALAAALDVGINLLRTRVWVQEINPARKQLGEHHQPVQKLHLVHAHFRAYFSLNRIQFEIVLEKIGHPSLRTQTNYMETISSAEQLRVCLPGDEELIKPHKSPWLQSH